MEKIVRGSALKVSVIVGNSKRKFIITADLSGKLFLVRKNPVGRQRDV